MIKKYIFFCVLVTIHTSFCAVDQIIIKEYPELISFFNSSEFKKHLADTDIKTANTDSKNVASTVFEYTESRIKKTIVLNTLYINSKIFSAEEIKFIICHELGHLNDDKLPYVIGAIAGHYIGNMCLGACTIKSLIQQKWYLAGKQMIIGTALSTFSYLAILKMDRDRETFADSYAIAITKNKDAAESALLKRPLLIGEISACKYKILKKVRELFNGHPNEDTRIENIKKLV